MKGMRIVLALAILFSLEVSAGAACHARFLYLMGNEGSLYPFIINMFGSDRSLRYQQIYDKLVFSSVGPECRYITYIQFRTSPRIGRYNGWYLRSIQINISTTPRAVDDLSPLFAENVGVDDTVIFGPERLQFSGSLSGGSSQRIYFKTPFVYDPSKGNILLDIRIFDGGPRLFVENDIPLMETNFSPTDEVSRIYADDVNAVTATDTDSAGLTASFEIMPIPRLSVEEVNVFGTDYIRVSWPGRPIGFGLQTTPRLGFGFRWTDISVVKGSMEGFKWVDLPKASLEPAAFFRLLSKQ